MSVGGKDEYNRFYCGLCKSLGDGFGTPSRALVGNDAVFLALLVDALVEEPAHDDRCRCPLLPVVHRPTVKPDSVAMRYASAMQMLLGDQLLADRAAEGKFLAKTVRPLAQRQVTKAREILSDLGIDLSPLDGFEHRQASCEITGTTGPIEAAAPTAEALAFVFSSMLGLPGANAASSHDDLAKLGSSIGAAIYLIDALEDLEKDLRDRAFNPCVRRTISGHLVADSSKVELCVNALFSTLEIIRRALDALPLRRHREVLRSVVTGTLPAMARKATSEARAFVRAQEAQDHLRAWVIRAGELTGRATHAFFVTLVVLWSWVLGIRSAIAKPKPTTPPRPDAGQIHPVDAGRPDEDCDAGAPFVPHGLGKDAGVVGKKPCKDLDAGLDADAGGSLMSELGDSDAGSLEHEAEHGKQDDVVPEKPTGAGDAAAPDPLGCRAATRGCCSSACGECTKPFDACCSGCGCSSAANDCCKSCSKPCDDLCTGCGKPCNDCCKGCSDPCKGCCSGCDDPCKSCCKGCDDPCKGCCSGCNDPCKGCCNGCNCNGCCK